MALGARVVAEGRDVVLVATGSEVHPALAAREILETQGISARVVSMPSWELFGAQDATYRDGVLTPGVPRLGVEARRGLGWCVWADDWVSLERFGASAPADLLFREFGFTPEHLAERARRLVRGGWEGR